MRRRATPAAAPAAAAATALPPPPSLLASVSPPAAAAVVEAAVLVEAVEALVVVEAVEAAVVVCPRQQRKCYHERLLGSQKKENKRKGPAQRSFSGKPTSGAELSTWSSQTLIESPQQQIRSASGSVASLSKVSGPS
jgi:hypothetical protein